MTPEFLAITPGDGRELAPWIQELGQAGLPALLLREPGATPAQVLRWLRLAHEVIPDVRLHLRSSGAADLLGAYRDLGVHLPEGEPIGRWRGRWPGRAVGVSRHDAAGVRDALAQGADLVFLSPVWPPTSKPDDARPGLGMATFLEVARARPVLALGGVSPERHRALKRAGAAGSAVLGDLFGQPDPPSAARRLRAYLAEPA